MTPRELPKKVSKIGQKKDPAMVKLFFEAIFAFIHENPDAQFTIQLSVARIADEKIEDLLVETDLTAQPQRAPNPSFGLTQRCI